MRGSARSGKRRLLSGLRPAFWLVSDRSWLPLGTLLACPAQTDGSSWPQALPGARVFGGDPLSALHRRPLCRAATRARLSERRDVSAQAARVDRAGRLAASAGASCLRARPAGQPRLVAGRCRRVGRGRKKRGDLVGPSPVNLHSAPRSKDAESPRRSASDDEQANRSHPDKPNDKEPEDANASAAQATRSPATAGSSNEPTPGSDASPD
jgi:hypothetical protein